MLFDALLWFWFFVAAVTCPVLFFVAAPYGRHVRGGWGPVIGDRLGWMVMEAPAALVFGACFATVQRSTIVSVVLFAMWEAHYVHRAFIYPVGLRGLERRMPVSVVCIAFLFNSVNGYLNGRYLFGLSGGYPVSWLTDPRFLVGVGLFGAGYLINRGADRVLRGLRKPGESGYKIPYGGLFRWISCPNYLGEILEWIGWAVATWSLPGLAFAAWVVANLVPRAWSHHRWYRAQFADYPEGRRALLPGIF
jgi:protein-S-isoprenylcysteine O-methyltransferase Ste14